MSPILSNKNRILKIRLLLTIFFIILFFISLLLGVDTNVTITKLLAHDQEAWRTMLISRLPRTISIVLTAVGLSIAGLIMQSISRNKFLSPSTVGTTDASILGVLLSFILFNNASKTTQMVFAFLFSLIATTLIMTILNKIKIRQTYLIPLLGMMYGSIISSITQAIAYQTNSLQYLSSISVGSFNRFTSFNLLYIIIVPLILAVIYSTRFSIISLGEDFSKNLGIHYNRTIFLGMIIIATISAATFITVGPIPFIGLIVPNVISEIVGDNIKKSMLDIVLFGSSFVLLSDIMSRLIVYPYEIAISFTIGIIGGIIFIYLLFKKVRYGT